MEIKETKKILEYLEKRQILNQYLKEKNFILFGNPELANLKLKKAKNAGLYYFRKNK